MVCAALSAGVAKRNTLVAARAMVMLLLFSFLCCLLTRVDAKTVALGAATGTPIAVTSTTFADAGVTATDNVIILNAATVSLDSVTVFDMTVQQSPLLAAFYVANSRVLRSLTFRDCRFPGVTATIVNTSVEGGPHNANPAVLIAFSNVSFPADSSLGFSGVTVSFVTRGKPYDPVPTALVGFDAACSVGANVTHEYSNVTLSAAGSRSSEAAGVEYAVDATTGVPGLQLRNVAPGIDGNVDRSHRIRAPGFAIRNVTVTRVVSQGPAVDSEVFTAAAVDIGTGALDGICEAAAVSTPRTAAGPSSATPTLVVGAPSRSSTADEILVPPNESTHTNNAEVPSATLPAIAADPSSSTRVESSAQRSAPPKRHGSLSVSFPTTSTVSASASVVATTIAAAADTAVVSSEPRRWVVVPPIPGSVVGGASVLSGFVLPSSVSKPFAVARTLGVSDSCLAFAQSDDDVEGSILAAEPGEWPSDYAVIIARWRVGDGGGSAARARGTGAALAAAVAIGTSVAASLWWIMYRPVDMALQSPSLGLTRAAIPTAIVIATAFLVPNALEAAAVAMTTTSDAVPTLAAGAAATIVLIAAAFPIFSASVLVGSERTETKTWTGHLAAFVHPVLVDGLRDESQPLLRAHGALDFAVACVIAAVGGVTQAGVRIGGSCIPAAAVMFACALGLTANYAVMRPFEARLEVAVATGQAGALAVLCGLLLAAMVSGGAAESWGDRLSTAGFVAEAVTLAGPLVLLAAAVRQRFRRRVEVPPQDPQRPQREQPLLSVPRQEPTNGQSLDRDRASSGGGVVDLIHVPPISNPLAPVVDTPPAASGGTRARVSV